MILLFQIRYEKHNDNDINMVVSMPVMIMMKKMVTTMMPATSLGASNLTQPQCHEKSDHNVSQHQTAFPSHYS